MSNILEEIRSLSNETIEFDVIVDQQVSDAMNTEYCARAD